MDLATFEWLLTDDGQHLLEAATHAYVDHAGDPVRSAAAVRTIEPDPDRSAAALTQVGLRARGVAKFGADSLRRYFTQDPLGPSHPPRFPPHRARLHPRAPP